MLTCIVVYLKGPAPLQLSPGCWLANVVVCWLERLLGKGSFQVYNAFQACQINIDIAKSVAP